MRRSPSIEDFATKEEAFKDYLAILRKDIEKTADVTRKKKEETIIEYYKASSWDDLKLYALYQDILFKKNRLITP